MSCGYEVDNEPITPRVQRIQKLRGYAWAEKGHIRDRWIRASMIYFAVEDFRNKWVYSGTGHLFRNRCAYSGISTPILE